MPKTENSEKIEKKTDVIKQRKATKIVKAVQQ
jgi:hypothetical protein